MISCQLWSDTPIESGAAPPHSKTQAPTPKRCAPASVARRATMLGRDSRAECEAVRRHKFPICDPVQHDPDVRTAAEENARGPFFARRRFHHGREPRLRRMGQSAKAKLYLDDKRSPSHEHPLDSVARNRLRLARASADRAG